MSFLIHHLLANVFNIFMSMLALHACRPIKVGIRGGGGSIYIYILMNIKYGHIIKTHQNIKGNDTHTAAIPFNECQSLGLGVCALV